MNLNQVEYSCINVNSNRHVDASSLMFSVGHKSVFDVLVENVRTPGWIANQIKIYQSCHNWDAEIEMYNRFCWLLINSLSLQQQHQLFDLALNSDDLRFAAVMLANPVVSITPVQFDTVYNNSTNHKIHALKEFLISNNSISLTDQQLTTGLLTPDYGMEQIFALRSNIPAAIIDQVISIKDSDIANTLLTNIAKNNTLTPAQIDYGLEQDFETRLAIASNYNNQFTSAQIAKLLLDPGFDLDNDYYYDNYNQSDIIVATLNNPNYQFKAAEFDPIFNNKYLHSLISTIVDRPDFEPSPSQLDTIVSLKDQATLIALKKYQLTEAQLLTLITSNWKQLVIEHYVSRTNISDTISNVLSIVK